MADILAHAGGVDEIILGIGVVALYFLYRSSRAERLAREPEEGPCLYCGHHLGPSLTRCPECGFAARRGATSSTTGEAR